jgi:hypothetical protein
MSDAPTALAQSLRLQATACDSLGSPFSGGVARVLAEDIDAGGVFAGFAAPWADADVRQLFADAVPLRFLGGLHHLVLTGDAPGLAALYPPLAQAPSWAALAAAASIAVREHQGRFADFLKSPPQTNEVNRSICLIGGFLTVARWTGLPLRCLEIGASAGLNLNWSRYRYDLGADGAWGDAASPVRLSTDWSGPPPPFDQAAAVMERRGCDRQPIDIADPAQALRLQAYVWPDQIQRLERLRGAIALARENPPTVEAVDAGAWAAVHAHPVSGAATVLYHSVVWQYLSDETRDALSAAIQVASESATADKPFAWLRMEPVATDMAGPMEVRLTQWPEKRETLIARVHPHGARVEWTGF